MFDLMSIPRKPVEEVLAGLRSDSQHESKEAATRLLASARNAGLGMRDYLTWAIDPNAGENAEAHTRAELNGYEAALSYLKLPFHNDLERGVHLQAASDSFQTYPGTRALFPEVIDDMLRWKYRQETYENTGSLVAQSRTISGNEMISTVVDDDKEAYNSQPVPEMGIVPVRTIKSSQTSVAFYKHGSGYRSSYEFNRRASLDLMTPYASRVARELEISKVRAATSVLINGDGVNPAAPVKNLSEFGADFSNGKSLQHNYKALAKFVMEQAKAGIAIDTLAVNFDTFIELFFMYAPKQDLDGATDAEKLATLGGPSLVLPSFGGNVTVALSSGVPANTIVAFAKAETLEELVEAGSSIAENERSILNQSVTYVRTETTGYKLAFGDTRVVLKTNA